MHQSKTKIQIWITDLRVTTKTKMAETLTQHGGNIYFFSKTRNNIRVTKEVTLKSAREIELTVCTSFSIN